MTNIQLKGQKEIDLLAMDNFGQKFHIEARVSTSRGFAIREKDTHTSNGRPHKIGLDYFAKEKFNHPTVVEKIHELFGDSDYRKALVVWTAKDFAELNKISQDKYGFEVWDLRSMINNLMLSKRTTGSRDDILRVMELVALHVKDIWLSTSEKNRKMKCGKRYSRTKRTD